jgi:hypothetical protein
MQGVIVAPVLEVLSQSASDLETAVAGHRDIAKIEEAMDVGAEKESVRYLMLAACRKGAYMRGV